MAIIGAGPTAASLVERLVANAADLIGERPLRLHLIDPYRAGTGRVWRPDLHPGLWMNSMAEDVTLFTDDSVQCDGPIRPGPSLYEWALTVDDATLAALAPPAVAQEIRSLGPMTFPTRLVQSVYLDWFHRHVASLLPANVEVVIHARRAVDLFDRPDGRQSIHLEVSSENTTAEPSVEELVVDEVVLALGHLDAEPDADGAATARFAARHGRVHLPPGHTAELDLSVLAPGADVIALGFGQAFTDLVVLVTEGRGGRFVDDGAVLRYLPSGREP
ncbi:MAG: FAD/NAD(P)-binding protein, partial [Ilumatobacteraceae bacterium]